MNEEPQRGYKRALITGITGMDGSHLADFLLEKGYEVYGMERRNSGKNRDNTEHLEANPNFQYLQGDLTDQNSLRRCLVASKPDEVYNLGAQSFVGESWNSPEHTSEVTGLGALRMLEAIREYDKSIRFYQASSSEMFGKVQETPQTEKTPFYPRSPYGVAKLLAHWTTVNYRESYDMYACSGILFNHESERRGFEFVTRKITDGVAKIALGKADHISLGNLDAERDWGYAPDYVEAMWMMLQQDQPKDLVISTGTVHSVRDFLQAAFKAVGIDDWKDYIKVNPKFMRPAEVNYLRGDSTEARVTLGWKPKVDFEELVERMVVNDLRRLE